MMVALVTVTASYAFVLDLGTSQQLRGPGDVEVVVLAIAIVVLSGLGVAAALRPSGCNRLIGLSEAPHQGGPIAAAPPGCRAKGIVGHHFDCAAFSNHLVHVAGKSRCAGCTGMVAGGIAGILVSITLGAGLFSSSREVDATAVAVAAAVAVAGFLSSYRKNAGPKERVLASLALVAGLVVIAAALSAFGAPQGAFGLCTAVAAIGLRIDTSRLLHRSVCLDCALRAATTSSPGAS